MTILEKCWDHLTENFLQELGFEGTEFYDKTSSFNTHVKTSQFVLQCKKSVSYKQEKDVSYSIILYQFCETLYY